MPNHHILHLLRQHGVETQSDGGNVLAYEAGTRLDAVTGKVVPCGEWVDVTGWGYAKLHAWLGY